MSVCALPNGTILTGAADKKIRIWYDGQKVKEWEAHGDIVRDFCLIKDIGFASCSNDETIKIWTYDGTLIQTLLGHTGFIFNISNLPGGDLASASDDKTVRIWRGGECVQSIDHPGTVWSVTSNSVGDLVTACEDKAIRTFTRYDNRRASEEET